jgi:hypothetical protein
MRIWFFPRSWLAVGFHRQLTGLVVVNLRGITITRRGRMVSAILRGWRLCVVVI